MDLASIRHIDVCTLIEGVTVHRCYGLQCRSWCRAEWCSCRAASFSTWRCPGPLCPPGWEAVSQWPGARTRLLPPRRPGLECHITPPLSLLVGRSIAGRGVAPLSQPAAAPEARKSKYLTQVACTNSTNSLSPTTSHRRTVPNLRLNPFGCWLVGWPHSKLPIKKWKSKLFYQGIWWFQWSVWVHWHFWRYRFGGEKNIKSFLKY